MPSFLLLAAIAAAALSPQGSSRCGSPDGRAFDFWIGDWTIEQKIARPDGTWLTLPAKTSVAPALGGCALIERWQGDVQFFWEGMNAPEPMQALSVRAFDPQSGTWQIHWMDTRSPRFGVPFSGRFRDGRGEFVSERQTPQGKRLSRITFSDIRRDAVHWELAVSTDDGRSWSTIWIMEMRRAAGRPDAAAARFIREIEERVVRAPTLMARVARVNDRSVTRGDSDPARRPLVVTALASRRACGAYRTAPKPPEPRNV